MRARSASWSMPRRISAGIASARSTSTSWRYTAEGMPGGVMLQIGIHYIDVLEYLIGPVKAVSGMLAQLVLPGDNPDVASLVLEHENGALSTVNASYASASEHYVMNIYGKEASAYYDLHQGLRFLKRGAERSQPVAVTEDRCDRRRARGICPSGARNGATGNGWRTRHGVARGDPRWHQVRARGAARGGCGSYLPRREHETICDLLCAILLALSASAQEPPFPQKGTIELTVLFPAGSSADITARLLAEGMSKHLPGNVIVVNRPGAGGAIGYKHVASQKPDGYALVWNSNSISTTYHSGQLPFDYRAFDPVARVLVESPVLAVRADAPWKTLGEFLADAKAQARENHRGQLGSRQPHAHLVRRAVQGRGRRGHRSAVRRGAGGAEPARWSYRCGGAAARRALDSCEGRYGAAARRADPAAGSCVARRAHGARAGRERLGRGMARNRGATRHAGRRSSPRSKRRSARRPKRRNSRAPARSWAFVPPTCPPPSLVRSLRRKMPSCRR